MSNSCGPESNCDAMQLALDSKAVDSVFTLNPTTMKSSRGKGVYVKIDGRGKKTILFFNQCPWCGAKLEPA